MNENIITLTSAFFTFFPDIVQETVIRDAETGDVGRGLDRDSRRESERKAWEDLHEDR